MQDISNIENNPNLDGDFRILLEIRKKKKEQECLQQDPSLSARSNLGSSRKRLSSTQFRPRQTLNENEKKARRRLFDAVCSGNLESLIQACKKVKRIGKHIKDIKEDGTCANALHFALTSKNFQVFDYLLESEEWEDDFLAAEFDVEIGDHLHTTKTCAHLLTAMDEVERLKKFLNLIKDKSNKKSLLSKMTLHAKGNQKIRDYAVLHLAAANGNVDLIKYLVLKQELDVDMSTKKGNTPLTYACMNGHENGVITLLRLGANPNVKNDKGSTALHWSVRYNKVKIVKTLLKDGKEINPKHVVDIHNKRITGFQTVIHLASALGYASIVQLLLDCGAAVNSVTENGCTPLHLASAEGNVDVVKLLLSNGADKEIQNDSGDTPLMLACQTNQIEVAKYLLSQGSSMDVCNKHDNTVWHYAIDLKCPQLLLAMIKYYRDTTNMYNHGMGKLPMHIAAMKGDIDKLWILYDEGFDLNTKDEAGNTLYHVAARENKVNVLEEFAREVNINLQNDNGDTALHIACRQGHDKAVRFLLKKASAALKNNDGQTILHVICKSKSASEEIIDHVVNVVSNAFAWTLVNEQDKKGNTALHVAAKRGNPRVIETLKNLNPRIQNIEGDSPLHYAARKTRMEALEQLMETFESTMDINQRNGEGDTISHIVAQTGTSWLLTEIIKNGANLATKDHSGNTVLHDLAVKASHDEENVEMYIKVWDTIVENATHWWCKGYKKIPLPNEDSELYLKYQKDALYCLRSEILNDDKLTVLELTAKLGVTELVQRMIQVPDIFVNKAKGKYTVDVTQLMPDTCPTKALSTRDTLIERMRRAKIKFRQMTHRVASESDIEIEVNKVSLLDIIVTVRPLNVANEMLDIAPLRQIVADYWNAYQWIYALLMIIHVTYMTLISVYSIPLLDDIAPPKGGNGTTTDETYNVYVPFLIWPIIILLFELYYIINRIYLKVSGKELRDPAFADFEEPDWNSPSAVPQALVYLLSYYLFHLLAIAFCVSTILWYATLLEGGTDLGYILATALLLGWLFTITFTDGFETVHSFTTMLKYMFLRDVMRFFIFYVIILVAFTFAFQALIQPVPSVSEQFPSFGSLMIHVFGVMIGVGDVLGEVEDIDDKFSELGYSSDYLKLLHIFYAAITVVVLLNLLIAMMNDSYSEVKAREGSAWRVESLELAMQIEKSFPFIPALFKALHIQGDLFEKKDGRYYMTITTAEAEEEVEKKKMDDYEKYMAILEAKLDKLTEFSDSFEGMMENMQEKMKALETKVDRVAIKGKGNGDDMLFKGPRDNGNTSEFDTQESSLGPPVGERSLTPIDNFEVIRPQIVPTDYASPSKGPGQYLAALPEDYEPSKQLFKK